MPGRRRPLVSMDGDLNGSNNSPCKKSRRSGEGSQKRIDSFFPNNTKDNTPESPSSLHTESKKEDPKSSLDVSSSGPKTIGPKEIHDSSRLVLSRHASIYGCDVSLWGSSLIGGDTFCSSSEPLHPWFENALNAYIHLDSGDEEHHTSEVNRRHEEESWLKILCLLNNSLSSRQHLSTPSLHKLLLHGVAHPHSTLVQGACANLFRKIIHHLTPPDSKRMRSYYLKVLAREEKGVAEYDDMEPWELLETLLESLLSGSPRYSLLLGVIVELLEVDFTHWYAKPSSGGGGSRPLLASILRFSCGDVRLNTYGQRIVQTYVSVLLDKASPLLSPLRTLVSLLAQVLGSKESKQDFVHFFAQVLREHDSLLGSLRQLLLSEMVIMKPSWLSFALSHALTSHLTNLVPLRGQIVSLRSALESYVQSLSNESGGSCCNAATLTPRKASQRNIHIAVDKRNSYGETPLHIACKRGNLERALAILSSPKVDVNAKDHNGWTPLHEACAKGMVGCVKALLDYKPSDIKNFLLGSSSQTPSTTPNSKRVDLLSSAGENGINPFHDCIIADNHELVNVIMEKVGSDPEFPSIKSLLSSTTSSGQSCCDLARSKEMKLILSVGKENTSSIPRKVIVRGTSFEIIKSLLINFMSKYISYFGLHVQKDFINFISKKSNDRKAYIRGSSWKCPSSNGSSRQICSSYTRSRETSVRDIRSYCSLLSSTYACPEIKRFIQALK